MGGHELRSATPIAGGLGPSQGSNHKRRPATQIRDFPTGVNPSGTPAARGQSRSEPFGAKLARMQGGAKRGILGVFARATTRPRGRRRASPDDSLRGRSGTLSGFHGLQTGRNSPERRRGDSVHGLRRWFMAFLMKWTFTGRIPTTPKMAQSLHGFHWAAMASGATGPGPRWTILIVCGPGLKPVTADTICCG